MFPPEAWSLAKAKDLCPYSVMENQGFYFLLHTLEPRYNIPFQWTLTEDTVWTLYSKTLIQVMKLMRNADQGALTCDSWMFLATDKMSKITWWLRCIKNLFLIKLQVSWIVIKTSSPSKWYTAALIQHRNWVAPHLNSAGWLQPCILKPNRWKHIKLGEQFLVIIA